MPASPRPCPACGRPLGSGTAPAACLRCQALYHPECWESLAACLAFGCAGTPADKVADLERTPPPRPCPACRHENPPGGSLCLSCGTRLLDLPARPLFTSASGWQAGTPEELIGSRLDRHWESGVQHLYRGDLEAWLAEAGRPDLADLARTCRKEYAQHSVGLEAFLEGTGLVAPPQVEVSPASLDLEGPGPTVTTFLEIRNGGRGYLSGRIRIDAPWLSVDPQDFAGHRTRIEVTARVDALPGTREEALLRLETPTVCWEVPVQARRIGVEQALDLYRAGEAPRARLLCRRFLEARPGHADAWVLKAACHLVEGNPVGAVQALRDLVGGCRVLPSDVVERVFRWLGQDDPVASGVDRVRVCEALLPCAEDPLAGEIRRALGRAAFERGQVAAAALKSGGGASLWQGHRASAEDVIELLQLAAACDPTLEAEATALRHQLRRSVKRGRMAFSLVLLVLVASLVAAGAASWAWSGQLSSENENAAMAAYQRGDYGTAVQEFRALLESDPQEPRYHSHLALALARQSRTAREQGDEDRAQVLMRQALDGSTGHPEAQAALASLLVDQAEEFEKKGLDGEARVQVERALGLDGSSARAQGLRGRLKGRTDLYWQVQELADGPLGRQVVEKYRDLPGVAESVKALASQGMVPFHERMSVAFVDVTGDGKRDLVVAGTPSPGSGPALGQYAVYGVSESRLEPLRTGTVRETTLLTGLSARDLSGNRRADVIMRWLAPDEVGQGATLLLACHQGRYVVEQAPSTMEIDLGDRDQDGRGELWVPEVVAESTGLGDRVLLYRPMLWDEPGFSPAKGDFTRYYQDYQQSLRQEIQDNPYPAGDPRFEAYRDDRLKALARTDQVLRSR